MVFSTVRRLVGPMLILCIGAPGCVRPIDGQHASLNASHQGAICAANDGAPGRGIAVENINAAIKPGDDFYRFVNHGWLTSQRLPPDRGTLGNFDILSLRAEQDIATIIERAASGADRSAEGLQIGNLYRSFVNRERVEALGLGPLAGDLSRIMDLTSHDEVARIMADTRSSSIAPMYVFNDAANPIETSSTSIRTTVLIRSSDCRTEVLMPDVIRPRCRTLMPIGPMSKPPCEAQGWTAPSSAHATSSRWRRDWHSSSGRPSSFGIVAPTII
jgi:hypothetical protein